jgi:hypothetical protein
MHPVGMSNTFTHLQVINSYMNGLINWNSFLLSTIASDIYNGVI